MPRLSYEVRPDFICRYNLEQMTSTRTDNRISLSARLLQCHTGAVHDVLRSMGMANFTLSHEIRPLLKGRPLAGEVFTIEGRPTHGADAHDTLLAWTGMLSEIPAGTIGVCQPNDSMLAHMGELSAEALHFRGIMGWVVDGGCRDTSFIERLGFRVFCRYFTPRDVVGCWLPTRLGGEITIGDARIRTGDFLLGDDVGIVVIPQASTAEVVTGAEEVMHTENLVRHAILQGIEPQQAYREHGKF